MALKDILDFDTSEEELFAQLKDWLKQNLNYILLVIVVIFGSVSAWRYYQSYQAGQADTARSLYLQIVADQSTQQNKAALDQLEQDHADSPYAIFAQLQAAKYANQRHEFDQAIAYLQPLLDSELAPVVHLAKLHLAEIYLAQEQYDMALDMLDYTNEVIVSNQLYFTPLYENLRGDILLLKKQSSAAKAAYQKAIAEIKQDTKFKQIVQMKLDNLK